MKNLVLSQWKIQIRKICADCGSEGYIPVPYVPNEVSTMFKECPSCIGKGSVVDWISLEELKIALAGE